MHSIVVLSTTTILLLLGTSLAQLADDAQCTAAGQDWPVNTTHATPPCNVPVLDAGSLSPATLTQRLAAATTPLLIRGLVDLPRWELQADTFSKRAALLEAFGDQRLELSVGRLLSNGPESSTLDDKKISFMQEAWGDDVTAGGGDGTAAGGTRMGGVTGSVGRQVRAGKPRPTVRLRDWLAALRAGETPRDAYVFQNISNGPIATALSPLHTLWHDVAVAQFDQQGRSPRLGGGAPPPALTRLGVGGSGSGAPFHDHDVIALNVVFAGRKRWLITQACRPNCRIPFYRGGAAVYHPERLLNEPELPAAALRQLADGGDTWDCTQHPGEVMFVPEGFLHATVNLEESVAVAVQCDDGADPRTGISAELNTLIVHANGVAEAFGPCGTLWEDASPFKDVSAPTALEMLRKLTESFQGNPALFLNRPLKDGHAPIDVAVRFGSVEVAKALAVHGARFLPQHLADAQGHGHAGLAAFISSSLPNTQ